MPNLYFAPIHLASPEDQEKLNVHLNMLDKWGVNVVNGEIRDPNMLPYVDGMVADFSFGDERLESEVLRARELGKPVLALITNTPLHRIPDTIERGNGLMRPY